VALPPVVEGKLPDPYLENAVKELQLAVSDGAENLVKQPVRTNLNQYSKEIAKESIGKGAGNQSSSSTFIDQVMVVKPGPDGLESSLASSLNSNDKIRAFLLQQNKEFADQYKLIRPTSYDS
jgi:hypothetical protein